MWPLGLRFRVEFIIAPSNNKVAFRVKLPFAFASVIFRGVIIGGFGISAMSFVDSIRISLP